MKEKIIKTMIARGVDARGRDYELYDYGANGLTPKTINGIPNDRNYRYWCYYCGGRVFACGNSRDELIKTMRYSTEESRYYGLHGRFELVDGKAA